MASFALEQLRTKALALSESERAELAHELVASLDGEAEAGAGAAWDEEILRRLDEVERGTAQFVTREEFKRRIRQHLKTV
jgi:putative addiction module component (TIGR02574 family)